MDYKQTNKPKKDEWIDDYKIQLTAYILAHNEVYKTNIRRGIVFMCSRDLQYQQFELKSNEFDYWTDQWLNKVEEYYTTGMQGLKQLLT
jgi:genome maintenance exonuclease 1